MRVRVSLRDKACGLARAEVTCCGCQTPSSGRGLTREGLTALSLLVMRICRESRAILSLAFSPTAFVCGPAPYTTLGRAVSVAALAGEVIAIGREGREIALRLLCATLIFITFITMRGCRLIVIRRRVKALGQRGHKVPINLAFKGSLISGSSRTVQLTSWSVEHGLRHCEVHCIMRNAVN